MRMMFLNRIDCTGHGETSNFTKKKKVLLELYEVDSPQLKLEYFCGKQRQRSSVKSLQLFFFPVLRKRIHIRTWIVAVLSWIRTSTCSLCKITIYASKLPTAGFYFFSSTGPNRLL